MADEEIKNEKQAIEQKKEKELTAQKTYLAKSSFIILAIVTIAAVIFALWAVTARDYRHNTFEGTIINRDGLIRGGGEIRRSNRDGLEASNQQQIAGVVTTVGNDTFTVAGSGSINTVTTNSDTKYTNDSKVSVNDSVVVLGTTSNNTFTATQVYVNP